MKRNGLRHQGFLYTLLGVLLFLGCSSSNYQQQVDQTLLLQENQRLEDALYVTHAQLVELKRENEALKAAQTSGVSGSNTGTPLPIGRPRRNVGPSNSDADEAPPFGPPVIEIPDSSPGSSTVPDVLKGSQTAPKKPQTRKPASSTALAAKPSVKKATVQPETPAFPELVLPVQEIQDEQSIPIWSPSR